MQLDRVIIKPQIHKKWTRVCISALISNSYMNKSNKKYTNVDYQTDDLESCANVP